jgi:tellurite resistance protein TerC
METIGSPLMWGGFIAFVLAMLALDLGVFHRTAHKVTVK